MTEKVCLKLSPCKVSGISVGLSLTLTLTHDTQMSPYAGARTEYLMGAQR